MSRNEIVTNEELQLALSERIRAMDAEESDPNHTKIYFAGARTLLSSVKIDIEASKKLGIPMFKRTKQFLGVSDA